MSLQRTGSHICGAVLVSSNFAITAAHCVDASKPYQYKVKCGAHNIHIAESFRQAADVLAITVHPEYNPSGSKPAFPNDIAVLKLTTNLAFDHTCQPAGLPSDNSNDFGNRASMITGWGRLSGGGSLPSRLKEAAVTVLTPSNCASRWGSTVNSNYHICILDFNGVHGACNGDSGGPVHVGNTVVGLASFVASGCLVNYPSVYVRVSYYMPWITQTIASMG